MPLRTDDESDALWDPHATDGAPVGDREGPLQRWRRPERDGVPCGAEESMVCDPGIEIVCKYDFRGSDSQKKYLQEWDTAGCSGQ